MGLFQGRWNPNCIKRNTAVQIAVATVAFLLLVRVWPCGLVQRHTYSRQQAVSRGGADFMSGDRFTFADKKLQTVTFSHGHIYRISLYMGCVVSDGLTEAQTVLFRLYDSGFSCVYEEEADSRRIEKKGVLSASPDMDVDTGAEYYYEILIPEESRADYVLPVADRDALNQPENGVLYIDGIYNDAESLIADFDYSRPLTAAGIILCDILILAAALLVYFLAECAMMLYDRRFAGSRAAVRKCVRMGTSIAAVVAALSLTVYAVVLNRFGGEVWDRLFFLAGIAAALAWLLAAVWLPVLYPRKRKRTRMSARGQISFIWRNYIQTVSFGLLFYALCQYVNADRNYYHDTNTRWMLVFLAIAFLMNYNEKQLVNKFSGIWLLLGTVVSAFYCRRAGADEKELLLARLTCGVVVAWGLLVLNILYDRVRSGAVSARGIRDAGSRIAVRVRQNRQQAVYTGLWAVFCIFMYANRYEKVWVFTATLPFMALFFAPDTLFANCRLLKNFSSGILLSFALTVVFCLLHRPHHYWMLYRYGGIFHTVACTGMYLAVVFGAALARLYGRLRTRKKMIRSCLAEYFVTSCAAAFILLTMSRTAFLTTSVIVVSVAVLAAVVYRKSVRRILAELGVLAAVCLATFPMVYTAVRMVPAVVNDPVRYDIEFQDRSFMVYEGDPINSDKYMTVRRFFSTLFGRFQISEQASGQEDAGSGAGQGLCWRESGELAYTGDALAGLELRPFYMGSGDMGSDDADDAGGEDTDDRKDISNGRFEIFGDYLRATSFGGHPLMGPIDKNGDEYSHAHNSYLQVAYNFGLVAGILFLVLCALTLWRSVRFALEYGSGHGIVFVPFALVVVFGFVSLTEWAYHPCIPAGFSFILMQMVLMRTDAMGR